MLLTLMTSLSLLFLWMKHPLSMGFILICQTFVVAVIIGMTLSSFLLSYIIIIIMLSGVLVLFTYMASVASNEKFQSSMSLMISFTITNFIIYMTSSNFMEMVTYPNNKIYSEMMYLIKMYSTSSAYITIMMILYLLITMIVTSNIATTTEGPLRIKN
uniref:NADH-ubiquinone oxidoreductase chain 6 n=1 Tax=Megymenum gracilicorne TaxID=763220 RepID=A0A4D6X3M3_9HEMI|nr:NADH dehydrogenase subunit 6 [Megymenum gracilicorne]QCI09388.1 NADH dehydrogenase subunit 6 [Megymenum gracilicorne]